MQIKQLKSEALKREYEITVPANDIDSQIDSRLKEIGKKAKLPGFRPGKVPMKVLKQNYGKNVMGEVLDSVVQQSSREALAKEKLRPALQPKIEIVDFEEGSDLKYTIALEVLPEIPEVDFNAISVEKLKVEIADNDVDEALKRVAEQTKDFQPVNRSAKKGDAVLIDFHGFVNDEAFEGGQAHGHQLELGSNSFIPGFEEQLIGAKAGDDKEVDVTFPKEYHSAELAGKDAVFKVKVHEVQEAGAQKPDDKLAEKLGFENLNGLKDALREQIEKDVQGVVRARAKRELFDVLEEKCDFPAPEEMLKAEYDSVWGQVQNAKKTNPDAPEWQKSDKELEEEYTQMAERRVKLGILLAEVGNRQGLVVTQEELRSALMAEASQYPGQEKAVIEYYQQHPEHLEALKGPVLEEKVVDFVLEKVKVKEKALSLEALQKLQDEPEKPVKKKAAAKKSGIKKATKKASGTKKKKDA